jgi:hypothetical protein
MGSTNGNYKHVRNVRESFLRRFRTLNLPQLILNEQFTTMWDMVNAFDTGSRDDSGSATKNKFLSEAEQLSTSESLGLWTLPIVLNSK